MKYLGQCQEKSSAVSLKVLGCSKLGIPYQGAELPKDGLQYNQPTLSDLQITHHNSEAKQRAAKAHLLSCKMGAISCSQKLISMT